MGLVAVKAVRAGLVPVAGLRIHHRDDPVRGGALEDPEAAVMGLGEVLAGDGGQQRRRLGHPGVQPLVPQGVVGPVAVADQRIHQLLAGGPIGPVTSWLAGRGVVVLAAEQAPDLGRQRRRAGPQQAPDRPAQHGHGVLGGDRVLQGCGVQHSLDPDQPHLTGQLRRHSEDPIRVG
jgi:hypothetical protein